MTARVLLAALLAITLAGCGGSTYVCFQFDLPDYCKLPPPPPRSVIVMNSCAYPLPVGDEGDPVQPAKACVRDAQCGTAQRCQVSGTKGACVWTLPAPSSGSTLLQPGESAAFRLPETWSGKVYAAENAGAGRAEITLRSSADDAYRVLPDAALPLRIQPSQSGCAPADAEHPGAQACRGAGNEYIVTFCAAPKQ